MSDGARDARRFLLSGGSIEALKWLALVLMTLDHINTFLYDGRFPVLFGMGRVAMPVFGFVLAYNLSRPGALDKGTYERAIRRLGLFGLLASPVFVAMVGWQPLNIMFTLLLAATLMYLLEKDGRSRVIAAIALLVAGGALVEFQWFGVLYCLAAWFYCKRPTRLRLIAWIAAAASLYAINHNLWALAALPVISAFAHLPFHVPRLRHIFYAYYPMHLGVLWVLAKMS